MGLRAAAVCMLSSKRFWLWEIAGILIYGIPVAIRFATSSVVIPILNFPGHWIGPFIPGNLLEKVIVNSFFPGGAGAVAGEIFMNTHRGTIAKGKWLYGSRLLGAFAQTAAWSAFQFFGYTLFIMGPYGSNIFEHPVVFPINFVLGGFSIFTPTILGILKVQLSTGSQRLKLAIEGKHSEPRLAL